MSRSSLDCDTGGGGYGARSSISTGEGATVKVVVRVRPANDIEVKASSPPVVQVQSADNSITVVKGSGKTQQRHVFTFDHVFGTYASQKEIFDLTLAPIVDDVLSGVESTVFAYGQTGTGKTYTMEGDISCDDNKGVIPRAVQAIFDKLEQPKYLSSDVSVSFLEIYNEDLTDLLSNESGLSICSNGDGKIVCKGLSQQPISTPKEVLRVLRQAQQRRQTGETRMNKQSSRSHCLFTLLVRSVERVGDMELERTGKLHLVDLAGSECAKTTGATGNRLRESQNINQSLLTLGRVISALREKEKRIPYRDSKLTRLLSQALGGECRTCIIATVSPSALCAEESMSTLLYADRAHGIQNKAANANVRMAAGAGGASAYSTQDSATFIEMQNRLDYMENQMLEAQTALARQHEANVELQEEMDVLAAKEAETQRKYDESCVLLAETRGVLAQTQADLSEQTAFTKSLQTTLRESVESLVQFADAESEGRSTLSEQVQAAVVQQTDTAGEVRAAADALLSGLQAKRAEFAALVQDFAGTNATRLQQCAAEQEQMGAALTAAVAAACDKLSTTARASSLVFTAAEDNLATWGRETGAALATHLSSLVERLATQERKVLAATEFFHRQLRAQLKGFSERQSALNGLSKAAREHAKLGSLHLESLQQLNAGSATHFAQLTAGLEQHIEFLEATRADRSRGQKDQELLESVQATTATLLAGAKGSLAALAVQRNLLTTALDYHKAQTADGVLQAQLDAFTAAYSGAFTEQSALLEKQIEALAATRQDQETGTIDALHKETIAATSGDVNSGIHKERAALDDLVSFQAGAAEQLIATVMDGVRALVTEQVTTLRREVEARVYSVRGVNTQLEATVGTRRAELVAQTETWASNNHAVAQAIGKLRGDSQAVLAHAGQTKALVDQAVTGFSGTTQCWGAANRDVDGRMQTAVSQNDALHLAITNNTSALEQHIATTTAEAGIWAAAGNACHAALSSAGEAAQAVLGNVALTTADHGRWFATASSEATESRAQAETNVDALAELGAATATAAKDAATFEGDMGAMCDDVAAEHTALTTLNGDVHASIRDAVTAGLAPRATVRTAVAQHHSDLQATLEQTSLDTAARAETLRACLQTTLDSRADASAAVQQSTTALLDETVAAADASKGDIDALCATIVEVQLPAFDAQVGAHNTTTNDLVDNTLQAHAQAVEKAISATTTTTTTTTTTSTSRAAQLPLPGASSDTSGVQGEDEDEDEDEDEVGRRENAAPRPSNARAFAATAPAHKTSAAKPSAAKAAMAGRRGAAATATTSRVLRSQTSASS
jgi:kinesin family protein 11